MPPSPGQNLFQFHAGAASVTENPRSGELAPPPRGNPGSATVNEQLLTLNTEKHEIRSGYRSLNEGTAHVWCVYPSACVRTLKIKAYPDAHA